MTMITRSDADALIPEEVADEILQNVPAASAVMRLGRRLPDMAANQRRLPVLSALPMAYFVDEADETAPYSAEFKQTTNAEWDKKYIYAEEIAVITPIPESVLDDAAYDIWGQIKPHILEAFGLVFDSAVLYGTNAPATWGNGIVPDAIAAGNSLAVGAVGDLYDDIMGGTSVKPGLIMHCELDGYFPNGYIGALVARGMLRGLRDNSGVGQPLFRQATAGMPPVTSYELDGMPVQFPLNGAVDETQSLLICGDWSKLVYAIRQDITYKVLTEAVIQNPSTGAIVYNLAQQDMVALRTKMRIGYAVANVINRINTNDSTRYPFSVLTPAVSP